MRNNKILSFAWVLLDHEKSLGSEGRGEKTGARPKRYGGVGEGELGVGGARVLGSKKSAPYSIYCAADGILSVVNFSRRVHMVGDVMLMEGDGKMFPDRLYVVCRC